MRMSFCKERVLESEWIEVGNCVILSEREEGKSENLISEICVSYFNPAF